jgi:endoglucanase
MNKIIVLTFFLGLTLLAFSQPNEITYFHRSNGNIIDPTGNRFIIKATNVSCWLYQENYIFGGAQNVHDIAAKNLNEILGENAYDNFSKEMMISFITSEDIRLMKRMGFNSVRVGFSAESFDNDYTKKWLFSSLNELLPVFKENNIAIILSMMRAPKPQNTLWTSSYTKGKTLLWDSEDAKQKSVDIWAEIASHYKDEQIILGYDIINEPNISKKREKEIIDLYQRITAAIRKNDSNHMIIYEGNGYATKLDVLSKYDNLLDANACYQFHFYSWFGDKIEKRLPLHINNAQAHNRPVFCGEFGINRLPAIKQQVDLMNNTREMDGWAMYTWKSIELTTTKEEKKRPPYYGKWIFIPFEDLHMSVLQLQMDNEMRDVMDWLTNVKGSKKPTVESTANVIEKIIYAVKVKNCKIDKKHIEALGLKFD